MASHVHIPALSHALSLPRARHEQPINVRQLRVLLRVYEGGLPDSGPPPKADSDDSATRVAMAEALDYLRRKKLLRRVKMAKRRTGKTAAPASAGNEPGAESFELARRGRLIIEAFLAQWPRPSLERALHRFEVQALSTAIANGPQAAGDLIDVGHLRVLQVTHNMPGLTVANMLEICDFNIGSVQQRVSQLLAAAMIKTSRPVQVAPELDWAELEDLQFELPQTGRSLIRAFDGRCDG